MRLLLNRRVDRCEIIARKRPTAEGGQVPDKLAASFSTCGLGDRNGGFDERFPRSLMCELIRS